MASSAREVLIKLKADTTSAVAGIQQVGDKIDGLGKNFNDFFAKISQPPQIFEKLASSINTFTGATTEARKVTGANIAALAAVGTAATVAIGAMTAAVKVAGQWAEGIERVASQTGLSVAAVQKYSAALAIVGGSTDDLVQAQRQLSLVQVEAAQGFGSSFDQLKNLVGSEQAATLATADMDKMLKVVADKFVTMPDGAEKSRFAIELFGRAGLQMIPILNKGAVEIDRLKAQALSFGAVLSDPTIKNLNAADDAFDRLGIASSALAHNLAGLVAPAVQETTEQAATFVGMLSQAVNKLQEFIDKAKEARRAGVNKILDLLGVPEKTPPLIGPLSTMTDAELKGKEQADLAADIIKNAQAAFKIQKAFGSENAALAPGALSPTLKAQFEQEKVIRAARAQAQVDDFEFFKQQTEKFNALVDATFQNRVAKQQDEERMLKAGNATEFDLIMQRLEVLKAANQAEIETEGRVSESARKDMFMIRLRQVTEEGALLTAAREETQASSIRADENRVKAMELSFASEKAIGQERITLLRQQQALEQSRFRGTPEEQFALTARQQAEQADLRRQVFGGFFANYGAELQKFTRDTETGFGLARQTAIQTAQAMTQGFQTFFFDVFTNKITTMADVLRSFSNFVLQVMSNILANMATTGLLKGGANLLMSFTSPAFSQAFFHGGEIGAAGRRGVSNPALFGPGFASGGVATHAVAGVFGEKGPEALVPLDRFGGLGGDVTVQVFDQRGSGAPVQTSTSRGPDGRKIIKMLIRDEVKNGFGEGAFDRAMNLNFGLARQGAQR